MATTPLKPRSPVTTGVMVGVGAVIAAFFLFPYLVMLVDALKSPTELYSNPLWPKQAVFGNYKRIFDEQPGGIDYWTHLKSSVLIAVTSTVMVLVVAVPSAYYTARTKFRGRKAYLYLVLMTQMFAPAVLVIGLYRQYLRLGAVWEPLGIDHYLPLILVNAAFNLAFATWILSSFFASIPKELEEAAMLDGCTRVSALWRVMLPLARPGIVTATIFTFIAAWNEFAVGLTLIQTQTDKQPLTVSLSNLLGAYEPRYDLLFAGSVIAVIPVVALFALIEKHLVGGLTAGSVK